MRCNVMHLCTFVIVCLVSGVAGAQVIAPPQDGSTAAGPEKQRAVKHNPFLKPDLSSREEPHDVEEINEVPQKILRLRAVLYSNTKPMVNINGKILTLGEQIEGFLLQEVSEEGAILSKDDVQIMLSMNEDE